MPPLWRLRDCLRYVVPVHDGVEDQVELAMVLPAIDRVVREKNDAALTVVGCGNVDGKGSLLESVCSGHEAGQDCSIASYVTRQDIGLIRNADAKDKAAGVFDG